ncbi:MAG TPA: M56 family metallopeptidase [Bryobacteraceae bacterium]|jgi:beta-lactamase regulating signal transducer with metallopeptidase domain
MSSLQETIFDLLINALLQVGFFAIVAVAFSPLVARTRAKHQYWFYLAVLLFCLGIPVINTFWHSPSTVIAEKFQQPAFSGTGGDNEPFWIWQGHSKQHKQFSIPARLQFWLSATWGALILLRLVRFSLAVRRVRRVRTDASVLSRAQVGKAGHVLGEDHRIALLESAAIDDPVTVGVFHPAILLPSKLLPELGEQDLSAILAHEYGHIRRMDFLVHLLCELFSLPMAWHPGIGYVMSKISQTRELASDDYAATLLGKRRSYANTLLRVASLCLHVPRSQAIALGIFDGDNLETRIMMLTEKTLTLSRAGVMALALAISITFGGGAVLAHAMSRQANSETPNRAEKFAGTWYWMFDGRSFATMILDRSGSGFTGTVTGSRIALNDDGTLSQADPSEDSTPKPIAKARLEGSALRLTVTDGFEFMVTLKDDTHAEIRPVGAPPKMKPIPAEKVR